MDALLFHPRLVHLPIALAVLMPLVAGGLALAWWRGWLPRRAWIIAIGLQAILVGSGIFAMRSGEAAEDQVERVVAKSAIHAHEEAAEVFVWTSAGVLAAMLLAGALAARGAGLPLAGAATLGTLLVLWLGYRTGEAGGKLVYVHGAAQVYVTGGASAPAPATHDDD